MSKFVLVLSFDEPEDGDLRKPVKEILDICQPLLELKFNRHVWLGIKDSADAVLNVIGVD